MFTVTLLPAVRFAGFAWVRETRNAPGRKDKLELVETLHGKDEQIPFPLAL